jgi:hypothetical protein
MTNVKEFREEESTLNIALFLSKNLYHLNPFPVILIDVYPSLSEDPTCDEKG